MSDSESIESQTDTEHFTDNEDIVEQCSGAGCSKGG